MREIRGPHVAAFFVGGFGIIVAVNVILATAAVRTFPGLEVANSYVASQSFDDRRRAQEVLGWHVEARYESGRLHLDIRDEAGRPAPIRGLAVHLGRPTEARDDRALALTGGSAPLDLAPGRWRIDISGRAPDGTLFEKAVPLRVPL